MANTTKGVEVKTIDQLRTDLAEAQNALAISRRSFMQGELVNPKVMGVQRKSIARILTEIKKLDKESK